MQRDSLTEKQRRFVEAYMGEAAGNASKAAKIAGYRGNSVTLGQVGAENLQKPQIKSAIAARVRKDPRVAKRKDLQAWWTEIMHDRMAELKDRLRASELLAKSQGQFISRSQLELKGQVGVTKKAEELTDDELAAAIARAEQSVGPEVG
jgi:phage terminase small subunit